MEGDQQVIVGANLRRLRRARGCSQETLARQLGWHRTFVGAVERGERNLTLRTVERLCEQLGVHTWDLLWDRAHAVAHFDDGAALVLRPAPAGPNGPPSAGSD